MPKPYLKWLEMVRHALAERDETKRANLLRAADIFLKAKTKTKKVWARASSFGHGPNRRPKALLPQDNPENW